MAEVRRSEESVEDESCDGNAEAQRWVAALTLLGCAMTVLLVIGLYGATTSSDADRVCFRDAMNDGHTLMEAFFPNPPEANAIALAIRACSSGGGGNFR